MSVDPKAKRSALSYLNISWVQHIDILATAQVGIFSERRTRWISICWSQLTLPSATDSENYSGVAEEGLPNLWDHPSGWIGVDLMLDISSEVPRNPLKATSRLYIPRTRGIGKDSACGGYAALPKKPVGCP
jgi:hypothetical protein